MQDELFETEKAPQKNTKNTKNTPKKTLKSMFMP